MRSCDQYAYAARLADTTLRYGTYGQPLTVGPAIAGGAAHVAFDPTGTLYFSHRSGNACTRTLTTDLGCVRGGQQAPAADFFVTSPDGQRIYVLAHDGWVEKVDRARSATDRVALSEGPASPVAAGGDESPYLGITPDEKDLFYVDLNVLTRQDLTTGAKTTFRTLGVGEYLRAVLVDARHVYLAFVGGLGASVFSAPVDATALVTMKSLGGISFELGSGSAYDFVQDARAIYAIHFTQIPAAALTLHRMTKR